MKKQTNKTFVPKNLEKFLPTEPTNEEFEKMTDDEVIDFAEDLGIKFAERFPEIKAVTRTIKRFYADLKFKPSIDFHRITDEDITLLKQVLQEHKLIQS